MRICFEKRKLPTVLEKVFIVFQSQRRSNDHHSQRAIAGDEQPTIGSGLKVTIVKLFWRRNGTSMEYKSSGSRQYETVVIALAAVSCNQLCI